MMMRTSPAMHTSKVPGSRKKAAKHELGSMPQFLNKSSLLLKQQLPSSWTPCVTCGQIAPSGPPSPDSVSSERGLPPVKTPELSGDCTEEEDDWSEVEDDLDDDDDLRSTQPYPSARSDEGQQPFDLKIKWIFPKTAYASEHMSYISSNNLSLPTLIQDMKFNPSTTRAQFLDEINSRFQLDDLHASLFALELFVNAKANDHTFRRVDMLEEGDEERPGWEEVERTLWTEDGEPAKDVYCVLRTHLRREGAQRKA